MIDRFNTQDDSPVRNTDEDKASLTGQVTKRSTQHIKVPKRKSVTKNTETSRFNINHPKPLSLDAFPDKSGGKTLPTTIPNVQHMLNGYDIKVDYNTIKKKLEINVLELSGSPDNLDNAAYAHISSLATLNHLSTRHLSEYLLAIGNHNQFNPVANWIESKPWDGKDRLPAIYNTITENEGYSPHLKVILIYKWLLSCVAAAFKPIGFKARGVLTLQGGQSIGKTSWFYHLIDNPLLREDLIKLDHHLDPSNKDSVFSAVSHWIVEIGELDSSFKNDIARLKGLITADKDKLRQPYARTTSEYQRRTVFCATVNSPNFLVDDTGNTRWWTIPVTKIDYEHGIDMQQVFAQLKVDFDKGKPWWLAPGEERLLEDHNKQFRSVSVVHDILSNAINIEASKNNPEVKSYSATEILRIVNLKHPTNTQCKECHSFLRNHIGAPKKIQGSYKWRIVLNKGHSINEHDSTIDTDYYGDGLD